MWGGDGEVAVLGIILYSRRLLLKYKISRVVGHRTIPSHPRCNYRKVTCLPTFPHQLEIKIIQEEKSREVGGG